MKQNLHQARLSNRILGLALLGVLSLTMVSPIRVMASQQNPEPPAQPTIESTTQEAQNPARTEAAKTEEQENDQYRHAPIVQTLARFMHVDVETAARTFEIFNVSVVVLGIVIPLIRIMPKLLRKRSEKIRADIDAARKTTEDANTRLSAVEAKLASLDQEIAKIRVEVEQQIGRTSSAARRCSKKRARGSWLRRSRRLALRRHRRSAGCDICGGPGN